MRTASSNGKPETAQTPAADGITVLIADDHHLVRSVLAGVLAREPDLRVVGEADTGSRMVDEAIASCPDVVVSDMVMPGLTAFEAARRILARCPDIRFVMMSGYESDWYLQQALDAGARGFVPKAAAVDQVVEAVRAVAAGEVHFPEDVLSRIAFDAHGPRLAESERHSRLTALTARERDILSYIAGGHSKKHIAGILSISPKTVDRHTSNLMQKLDIHDRVQLARFAIREGIAQA